VRSQRVVRNPGSTTLRSGCSTIWLGLLAKTTDSAGISNLRFDTPEQSLARPGTLLSGVAVGIRQIFPSGEGAWVNALLLLTAAALLAVLIYHVQVHRADGRRALARDLERRRFLENVLESLAHPFYVIDAKTHEVLMANAAARSPVAAGPVTCHRLMHGLDVPCDGDEHACPLRIVRETRGPAVTEHTHQMGGGEARIFEVRGYPVFDEAGELTQMIEYSLDITERKKVEAERERLIQELETALSEVKTLSGMLPICSSCKKVRDDHGYWKQIEEYISQRSDAQFSHSVCPDCAVQLYPEWAAKLKRRA